MMSGLEGKKIKSVRPMTAKEFKREGWERTFQSATVIEFDDGTLLYPAADDEGNGPGALFGVTKKGDPFRVL